MKIYLSDYWRKNSLFNLCLIILIIVGTVIFCAWSRDSEDYIMIICSAWFVLVLSSILLCSKRFLTYIIVGTNQVHSYSIFNKRLCTVDTTTPTYYAIFKTSQGFLCVKQFIALSNKPFQYQPVYGISRVRFIQHYNMKVQIVLPYNEKTIPLLKLEEWHNVN